MAVRYSIVIPIYTEEAVLPILLAAGRCAVAQLDGAGRSHIR